ncbi:MAG TPA: hypothetical protein VGI84_01500 [Pseudonocardiaceae bacterium]
MSDPDLPTAQILVAAEIGAQRRQVIADAFRALGLAVRIRTVPARRGPDEMQWLMLATLPLQAVLSGLGAVLAEDVAQTLKRLVGRLSRNRGGTSDAQVLILQDAGTGLQVVLEPDLPGHAYTALVMLDLSEFEQGPVHYDVKRRRWRSELDEWRHCDKQRRQWGGTEPP